MKDIEEFFDAQSPIITVNKDLDKYEQMPIFQEKNEAADAFLEQNPPPEAWIKEMKMRQIKRRFEQNMPVEQIAELVYLPKAEVILCLEEMGLLNPV